jgi:hypothetical protein
MNREPTYGIRGNVSNPGIRFIKNGGEMKIRRKLRTTAGVLLVLMLASGAQAATVVLDEIDFMHGMETKMFKFQAAAGIFAADVFGVAGDGSDLSLPRLLDLSLSRLKEFDEPIPTAALLILVGLIGLIALKGRRK